MKAVIKGIILNTEETDSESWIKNLSNLFKTVGKENKDWTFSHQNQFLLIIDAIQAFEFGLLIKSSLLSTKGLDVKIAIGIGELDDTNDQILDYTGEALKNCTSQFNELKKSNFAMKTSNEKINQQVKTVVDLVMFITNHWTDKMAEYYKIAFINQQLNQKELAKLLHLKSQSTISSILKRAAYEEILQAIVFIRIRIEKLHNEEN